MTLEGTIDEQLLSLQCLCLCVQKLLRASPDLMHHPTLQHVISRYPTWKSVEWRKEGISHEASYLFLQAFSNCLLYEPFVIPILQYMRPFVPELLARLIYSSDEVFIPSDTSLYDKTHISFVNSEDSLLKKEIITAAVANILRLFPHLYPNVKHYLEEEPTLLTYLQEPLDLSLFQPTHLPYFEDSLCGNVDKQRDFSRRLAIIKTAYRLLQLFPDDVPHCWDSSILLYYNFHSSSTIRWYASRATAIAFRLSNAQRNALIESLLVDNATLHQEPTSIDSPDILHIGIVPMGAGTSNVVEFDKMQVAEMKRSAKYERALQSIFIDSVQDDEIESMKMNGTQCSNSVQFHSSMQNIFGILMLRGRQCQVGRLLRRQGELHDNAQKLVVTQSGKRNIQALATAVLLRRPVLLCGVNGVGKTATIRELSRISGNSEGMIEIHLDEQIDTKTLFGSYVCTATPGEFKWQPGAITTATRKGNWVIIEDIDRAPFELLAALTPLLTARQMEIPGRSGEFLRAHSNFQLFGTISSHQKPKNTRGLQTSTWTIVNMNMLDEKEIEEIMQTLFPHLNGTILTCIMHTFLLSTRQSDTPEIWRQAWRDYGRMFTLGDLLKWCNRIRSFCISNPLAREQVSEFVTEQERYRVVKEACDVFTAAIREPSIRLRAAVDIGSIWGVQSSELMHNMSDEKPSVNINTFELRIGRVSLPLQSNNAHASTSQSLIMTSHTLRFLEKIAAAIHMREPILLVGETGCGKTAMIQQIANSLNQHLVVYNLNIQSDSGDLIGGYKPAELAVLARALYLQFIELFSSIFSTKSNAEYIARVCDAMKLKDWVKFTKGIRKAVQLIDQKLASTQAKEQQLHKKQKTHENCSTTTTRLNSLNAELERFVLLKDQLSSHMAFHFVEGVLIQALRHGHWVLLDEINLASADTLARISSLLDGEQASLTLVERGDCEKIYPHPNFRIFGAMNPSTDVGKRDLAPSLRHRFTEIYVDECLAFNDLEKVVQETLNIQNGYDQKSSLSSKIVSFYLQARQLAETQLSDGAGHKPRYSLRTLCRTIYIANCLIVRGYGVSRTLYEAFASTFCTALERDSRHYMDQLILKTFAKELKSKDLEKPPPRPGKKRSSASEYVLVRSYWLKKRDSVPIKDISLADVDSGRRLFVLSQTVQSNLSHIARAVMIGRFPVLLQGPTSAGKTSLITYLAQRIGQKCIRINNHEHTDLQEYLGAYTTDPNSGKVVFEEGALVQAVRNGWWVILDELNLAPSDVLEALNRLLDDHRELFLAETQQTIQPHENFMLFATQNPPGLYGGRKVLSRAFKNRFLEIQMEEVETAELQQILKEKCAIPPSFCTLMVSAMRDFQYRRQQSHVFAGKYGLITTRDLLRWAERQPQRRLEIAEHGYCLLAERLRKDEEKLIVKKVLEEKCQVVLDVKKLYDGNVETEEMNDNKVVWGTAHQFKAVQNMISIGNAAAAVGLQRITITQSMKRLFSLVGRSLQHQEPVLLIGDTGSGKTTVCQMYALLLDQPLYVLNCHQHTETSDMIGCYRPTRNKQDIADQLSSTLLELLQCIQHEHNSEWEEGLKQAAGEIVALLPCKLDLGLHQFQIQIRSHLSDPSMQHRLTNLDILLHRYRSIFEWVDGPLVKSMKEGGILLLDEVNLAQDAVLERLNSVLEPSRTLLLSEKGGHSSGEIVTAHPKWRILATMNPGGDYGKRELSPALRNRFTEIWVPLINEMADYAAVVHDQLVTYSECKELKALYQPMLVVIEYLQKNRSHDDILCITLRDLLSWIQFIVQYVGRKQYLENSDIWVAYVQGFALTILDGLGLGIDDTSHSLIQARRAACEILVKSICDAPEDARRRALESLNTSNASYVECHASFNIDNHLLSREVNGVFGDNDFGIDPFFIKRGPLTTKPSTIPFNIASPATYSNLYRVLRALQLSRPILLEGSPGVGKTSLIRALAQASGNRLIRINLSEQTDISDLFGSDLPIANSASSDQNTTSLVPAFKWCDGIFLQALKAGDWVLLDELNLASQSVLEGLNACLDHRGVIYLPELDKTFQCSKDFRIFAAQNPLRQGGGRKGLPRSFLNRFTRVLVAQLTGEDMSFIAKALFPTLADTICLDKKEERLSLIDQIVQFVVALHHDTMISCSYGREGAPWEFNLRDICRLCELIVARVEKEPSRYSIAEEAAADYSRLIFFNRFRTLEDRARVARLYSQYLSAPVERTTKVLKISAKELAIGKAQIHRQTEYMVEMPSSVPLPILDSLISPMEALGICVERRWPALLIGSPASGKTSSVRLLAYLSGHVLHEISLNAGTDSTELLGCFEQVEPDRQAWNLFMELERLMSITLPANLLEITTETTHTSTLFQRVEMLRQMNSVWISMKKDMTLSEQGRKDRKYKEVASRIRNLLENLCPNEAQNLRVALEIMLQIALHLSISEACKVALRFEWVDGTLLKAIETGDWVLLDNVNFCSASVLDRLNSLLEPDGELVLNECGLVDGGLRIVRPHPNFRIFLAMDAQFGEISRAMRNRCVEIALTDVENKDIQAYTNQLLLSAGVVCSDLCTVMSKVHTQIVRYQSRLDGDTKGTQQFQQINARHLVHWAHLVLLERYRGLSNRQALIRSFKQVYGQEWMQLQAIFDVLANAKVLASRMQRTFILSHTAPSVFASALTAIVQDSEVWMLERLMSFVIPLLDPKSQKEPRLNASITSNSIWLQQVSADRVFSNAALAEAQEYLYPAHIFMSASTECAKTPFIVQSIALLVVETIGTHQEYAVIERIFGILSTMPLFVSQDQKIQHWTAMLVRYVRFLLFKKHKRTRRFSATTAPIINWYRFCEHEAYEQAKDAVKQLIQPPKTQVLETPKSYGREQDCARLQPIYTSSWSLLQRAYLLHHPEAVQVILTTTASKSHSDCSDMLDLMQRIRGDGVENRLLHLMFTFLRTVDDISDVDTSLDRRISVKLTDLCWKTSFISSLLASVPSSASDWTANWTAISVAWHWLFKSVHAVLMSMHCDKEALLEQYLQIQKHIRSLSRSWSAKSTLWKHGGHSILPQTAKQWTVWIALQEISRTYLSHANLTKRISSALILDPHEVHQKAVTFCTLLFGGNIPHSSDLVEQIRLNMHSGTINACPILFTNWKTRSETLHAICGLSYKTHTNVETSNLDSVFVFSELLEKKLKIQHTEDQNWLRSKLLYMHSTAAGSDVGEDSKQLVFLASDKQDDSLNTNYRPILLLDPSSTSDFSSISIRDRLVELQLSGLKDHGLLELELRVVVKILQARNSFDLDACKDGDVFRSKIESEVLPLLKSLEVIVERLLKTSTRAPHTFYAFQDLIWCGKSLRDIFSQEAAERFLERLRQHSNTIIAKFHCFLRTSFAQCPEILQLKMSEAKVDSLQSSSKLTVNALLHRKRVFGLPAILYDVQAAELLARMESFDPISSLPSASKCPIAEAHVHIAQLCALKDHIFRMNYFSTADTQLLLQTYCKELLVTTIFSYLGTIQQKPCQHHRQSLLQQLVAFRNGSPSFVRQDLIKGLEYVEDQHFRALAPIYIIPMLDDLSSSLEDDACFCLGKIFVRLGALRFLLLSPSAFVDPLERSRVKANALLQRLAIQTFQSTADNEIETHFSSTKSLLSSEDLQYTKKAMEKRRGILRTRYIIDPEKGVANPATSNLFENLHQDVRRLCENVMHDERLRRMLDTATSLHESMDTTKVSDFLQEMSLLGDTLEAATTQWQERYAAIYWDILEPMLGALYAVREGFAIVAFVFLRKLQNANLKENFKHQVICSFNPLYTPVNSDYLEEQIDFLMRLVTTKKQVLSDLCGDKRANVWFMEHAVLRMAQVFCSNLRKGSNPLTMVCLRTIRKVFDYILEQYTEEKEALEAKQAQEDSLIKYQTRVITIQTQEEAEEAEYAREFPKYEAEDMNGEIEEEAPPTMAINEEFIERLCEVHQKIYGGAHDESEFSWELFMRSFALLRQLKFTIHAMSKQDTAHQQIACSSYIAASLIQRQATDIGMQTETYSFHHDPCVKEVLLVIPLLHQLMEKLRSLLTQWPEHAILQQLSLLSNQILCFDVRTPLARILSAVQVLLQKAQEWEEYAAECVSISKELAPLIQLVTRWRRLELHSWPQLLLLRERRHAKAARQTWLQLYSILCGSHVMYPEYLPSQSSCSLRKTHAWSKWVFEKISMSECTQDGQESDQLFDLLDAYIRAACIGQFHERLVLFKTFRCQLETEKRYSKEYAPQVQLRNILCHLTLYYNRYEELINQKWRVLKAPIEKKLSEFCKLCRWDEQTYYSLQESAEKSHRKLIKFCRNYEEDVLKLPAQGFVDQAVSSQVSTSDGYSTFEVMSNDLKQSNDYIALTSTLRVERNANEDLTSSVTSQFGSIKLYSKFADGLDRLHRKIGKYTDRDILGQQQIEYQQEPYQVLEAFCVQIFDRIERLKKNASAQDVCVDPGKLTAKGLKFFQGAKKKALLDLLKELKAQGIQHMIANVPIEVRQVHQLFLLDHPEVEKWLQDCDKSMSNTLWNWKRADTYYYRIIEQLSALQFRSQKAYSADISPSEVERFLGFSQNMLYFAVQQRQILCNACQQHEELGNLMQYFGEHKSWNEACVDHVNPRAISEWFQGQKDSFLALERPIQELEASLNIALESKGSGVAEASVHTAWNAALSEFNALRSALKIKYRFPASVHDLEINAARWETMRDAILAAQGHATHEQLLPSICFDGVLAFLLERVKHDKICRQEIDIKRKRKEAVSDADSVEVYRPFVKSFDDMVETVLLAVQTLKDYKVPEAETPVLSSQMHALESNLQDIRVGQLNQHLRLLKAKVQDLQTQVLENSTKFGYGTIWKECFAALQAFLPCVKQIQTVSRQYLVNYILSHKAYAKFSFIVIRIFRNLLEHGFCRPQNQEDREADENTGGELEGTGMGEGEGNKDVSHEIEEEDQLLGLKEDQNTDQTPAQPQSPTDNGMEMENEFDGTLEDIPDEEDANKEDDNEEELDREMGDIDDNDEQLIDQKMWGEDTDDEGDDSSGKEKFDDNACGDAQPIDEICTKEDESTVETPEDEAMKGKDEKSQKVDEDGAVNEDDEEDHEKNLEASDEKVNADNIDNREEGNDLPEDMELDAEDMIDGEDNAVEMQRDDDNMGDDVDEEAIDGSALDDIQNEEADENTANPDNEAIPSGAEDLDAPECVDASDMHPAMQQSEGATGGDESQPTAESKGTEEDERMQQDQDAREAAENSETTPTNGQQNNSNVEKGTESSMGVAWKTTPTAPSSNPSQKELNKRQSEPNPYHNPVLAHEYWQRRVEVIEQQENETNTPTQKEKVTSHAKIEDEKSADQTEFDQFALAPMLGCDDVHYDDQDTVMEDAAGMDGEDSKAIQDNEDVAVHENDDTHGSSVQNDQQIDDFAGQDEKMAQDNADKKSTAFVEEHVTRDDTPAKSDAMELDENVQTLSEDLTEENIQSLREDLDQSIAQWAQSGVSNELNQWSKYKTITLSASQRLCEQLRLVLEPMLRSNLQGDYRTGKRLNMRKIIPYIASDFRKDKIWMRRTKPSKRAYQIMIAIDDSESMAENHAGRLALEAMTTLSRAMAQLEVGQISIAKFGRDVQLLHAFNSPFTDDAGQYVISQFGFCQTKTNMIMSLKAMLKLLDHAREQMSMTSQGNTATDITQIAFIMSDGRFDTDGRVAVKKLIEKGLEQQQLIVLLIVDDRGQGEDSKPSASILETKRVQFNHGKIQMIPYLDKYPFPYYVLLPDSARLPEILSDALRQWFELLSSRN